MYDESIDVQKFKHSINCLLDSDRAIRKNALDRLNNELFTVNKNDLFLLLREYLISPLMKCLDDKIQKHREITVKLIIKLLDYLENFDDKIYSLLLFSIISRLNHIPFPETSEELRQDLILLLQKILFISDKDFLPIISDLCSMIGKLLTDPAPEMKIKLSEFIIKLCERLGKYIGVHSKSIILSLSNNLKHSHNKVRKITIMALGDLLITENAGKFFEECNTFFKPLPTDKNSEVRKTFYAVIYKLLTNMNIIYLRKYEHYLLIYLLNGLSDEKDDIIKCSYNYLEEAGNLREKLSIELGEENEI